MTHSEFQDMGAHLSKKAWDYAGDMLLQGFPPAYCIKEAENFEAALKVGQNTKEVIYEKR